MDYSPLSPIRHCCECSGKTQCCGTKIRRLLVVPEAPVSESRQQERSKGSKNKAKLKVVYLCFDDWAYSRNFSTVPMQPLVFRSCNR